LNQTYMSNAIANANSLVVITHNLDIGGVQKNVAILANHQANHRKVIVVLLEDNKEIRYVIDPRIEIVFISTLVVNKYDKLAGEDIFYYRLSKLNDFFSRYQADIAIGFEDYSNILLMKSDFKGRRVLSCRVSFDHYRFFPRTHLLPPDFYFRNISELYKNADAIVCVSNWVLTEARKIVDASRIRVIYSGLDFSMINSYQSHGINFPRSFILNVSRLHDQKGLKVLIQAYALIAKSVTQDLVLIGDGPIRSELEKLSSDLTIDNRVHILGFIREPYAYMFNADLFVFPSINEGFSNSVLEAMYCGAGVIASAYSGYDEILKDYGNICDVGDSEQLAKLMMIFLQNKCLLKKLKDSQKLDASNFDVDMTCMWYQKVFDEL